MGEIKTSDYLPSASDTDFYKVHLASGDFLSVGLQSTGTAALNGSLAVFDGSNPNPITQAVSGTGLFGRTSPSVGFYADHEGDYSSAQQRAVRIPASAAVTT